MTEHFIGKAVALQRSERDISQEVLAGLSGVSRNAIAQIERGRNYSSTATICRIAEAMDVKPSHLLQLAEGLEAQYETPFTPHQVESLATRKQAA